MDIMDRIIADLVEGGRRSEGFMRGSRANVEVSRENRGREEKLAMDASTMLGGIPGLGPVLGGLNTAARENNMGTGALTTAGSALGQAGGAMGGAALGGLTDSDRMRLIGALLGQTGGGMLGAAGGRALGEHMSDEPMRGKRANLTPGGAAILAGLAGGIVGHGVGGPTGSAIGALSGPVAAAMHSDSGHEAGGAAGGVLGGLGGGLAGGLGGGLAGGLGGGLLGALAGNPVAGAGIGAGIGAAGGGLYGGLRGVYEGANYGGQSDSPIARVRRKLSTAKEAGIGDGLARALGGGAGVAMRNPKFVAPALGAGLGALSGVAGSEEGHRLEGALKGGLVGGGLGLAVPAGAQALIKAHPEAFMGGVMPKAAALETRYVDGVKAATDTFRVKEAILPLLGAIAGPMLARAGVGALARGAGSKMLGGMAGRVAGGAGKLLSKTKGGMGGAAFDMAGSMGGQMLGQGMSGQQ